MRLKNTLIEKPLGVIVKEPSSGLFEFSELTLNALIQSIRPEAHSMFANLKRLCLDLNGQNCPNQEISDMIEKFEEVNVSGRLESVHLEIYKFKDEKFAPLAKHHIQRLELHSSRLKCRTIRAMQECFGFLTELSLQKCNLDLLDASTFDFCASTLLKLDLWPNSIVVLQKGTFVVLENLKTYLKMSIFFIKKVYLRS
jgi:hypothetical protein